MKVSKLIVVLFGAWLVLGTYACKAKQGCDCPTFGNHAKGKTGIFKTNSKNH